jgi:hypothetical protein
MNLATEKACILGMLGDFNLLDLLADGSSITGAVLAGHSYLLCTLGHGDSENNTNSYN